MGVLEELARAREEFERGDWAAARESWAGIDPALLEPADLRGAGEVAVLLGRSDEGVAAFQRAFDGCVAAGDVGAAVRCAFHLSMTFGTGGEPALAAGWAGRAERLLEEVPEAPERGYVVYLHMFRHLRAGELAEAAARAEEATLIGRQSGDRDLEALGLCAQGRAAIFAGRVTDGLALLDESMAATTAGGLSTVVFGNVYCTAIEGCQEIADFGRVAEWTAALHRWCTAHPALVTFTGQCSLHRAQVMRQQGAWVEALEELRLADERYVQVGTVHPQGLVAYERGEMLRARGEYDAADAAYQRSAELGHDPQPGLALLWLARGADRAAAAAVRRLLREVQQPVPSSRLLPGAVEVLLGVGAVDEAQQAASRLEELSAVVGTPAVVAGAAQASGAATLAAGDPEGALPYLRKAHQLWGQIGAPYEVARTRVLVGRALVALGDDESARRELGAAAVSLRELGAAPEAEAAGRLASPERPPGGLTGREVEVLRLVAAGRSNAQIAAELVLSEKTVERHLSNIFGKLGVGSRTAAAGFAFEHGLA